MRILIVSNLFPPVVYGGYEQACANVAAELARRGHDIQVLTSYAPAEVADPPYVARDLDIHWFVHPELPDPGARTLQLHAALCSSFLNSRALTRALRRFAPDIVYVWNLVGIGLAGLIDVLRRAGAPYVVHLMDRMPGYLHDNVPPHVRDVFDLRGASGWEAGTTIAMSTVLLDEIERDCGFSLHREAEIVPGWIDTADLAAHGPYREGGVTRFVSAGAIQPHKGIELIIEAASRLARESRDFVVDLYGGGDITRYVDLARAASVADRLHFHGHRSQSDLRKALSAADAFLFPTWEREPFGFVAVEAAGCGTMPIMTRSCGASERLVDGVHCVKIDRSAASLLAAMRDVVDGRTDVARIGGAASALAREDLCFDAAVDRIERILARGGRGWNGKLTEASTFDQVTFAKHDLSVRLRFGMT